MSNPLFTSANWTLGADTAGGVSGYDTGGGLGDAYASHGYLSSWVLQNTTGSGTATLTYGGPPITASFYVLVANDYAGDGPNTFSVIADGVTTIHNSVPLYPQLLPVEIPACTTLQLVFNQTPNTDYINSFIFPLQNTAYTGNPMAAPELWIDLSFQPNIPHTLGCWDGTLWTLHSNYPGLEGLRYIGSDMLPGFSFTLTSSDSTTPNFYVLADGNLTTYELDDSAPQTIVVPPCTTLLVYTSFPSSGGMGTIYLQPIGGAPPPPTSFWQDFIGAVEQS